MLKFSKIDDTLEIYRNHKIIIWGTSTAGIKIYKMLTHFKLDIYAFCDNSPAKQGKLLYGLKILSPLELSNNLDNILIQIGSSYEKEIIVQLNQLGIDNYISYTEACTRLSTLNKYILFKDNPKSFSYYLNNIYPQRKSDTYNIWQDIMYPSVTNRNEYIILCMPAKTGDCTLMETLKAANIDVINFWHTSFHLTPELLNFIGTRKIKIITATRDPIAQNISELFQIFDGVFWDQKTYWDKGGDVEKLFKHFISQSYYDPETNASNLYQHYLLNTHYTPLIQDFYETQFVKNLNIDIYQYPFDKKQGYSIIQTQNIEIFIYQLEKLNTIYPALYEFLNIDRHTPLITKNDAQSKWYWPYYCETLSNIKLSQKYYDNCFNSIYINHFYSHTDVLKFQERWHSHIE